ncbi:hypothetical protein OBBRIDRAFT_804425 [Obba rivulosa]|uniref:Uncharacterized protein n=1 Tax=Obba rivulosa TaxID=1052685 RepID=A0A8E2AV84_9APHY|nr:hypothetical protein OBBRIDRAFT_804425 [Obba rivulosa]
MALAIRLPVALIFLGSTSFMCAAIDFAYCKGLECMGSLAGNIRPIVTASLRCGDWSSTIFWPSPFGDSYVALLSNLDVVPYAGCLPGPLQHYEGDFFSDATILLGGEEENGMEGMPSSAYIPMRHVLSQFGPSVNFGTEAVMSRRPSHVVA